MAVKSKIMVLEPDRLFAECIKSELETKKYIVRLVTKAEQAISVADEFQPDLVVSELTLAGHSASEFLYEYRSYSDFSKIPVIIYSSMRVPEAIKGTRDWGLLGVSEVLYKPDVSLSQLLAEVENYLEN